VRVDKADYKNHIAVIARTQQLSDTLQAAGPVPSVTVAVVDAPEASTQLTVTRSPGA
jgi:hypothetical protein